MRGGVYAELPTALELDTHWPVHLLGQE